MVFTQFPVISRIGTIQRWNTGWTVRPKNHSGSGKHTLSDQIVMKFAGEVKRVLLRVCKQFLLNISNILANYLTFKDSLYCIWVSHKSVAHSNNCCIILKKFPTKCTNAEKFIFHKITISFFYLYEIIQHISNNSLKLANHYISIVPVLTKLLVRKSYQMLTPSNRENWQLQFELGRLGRLPVSAVRWR